MHRALSTVLTAGVVAVSALGATTANATFIDQGGGVILDTATSLEWEQNANHGQVNWAGAGAYAAGLTLDGGGWRLPSLSELQQLYTGISAATGCTDCTGDQGLFTGIQLGYWSTAQYFAGQPGALYVGFWLPNYHAGLFQTSQGWAWAVRPGDAATVPEPASMLLLGLGALGLAWSRRQGQRR